MLSKDQRIKILESNDIATALNELSSYFYDFTIGEMTPKYAYENINEFLEVHAIIRVLIEKFNIDFEWRIDFSNNQIAICEYTKDNFTNFFEYIRSATLKKSYSSMVKNYRAQSGSSFHYTFSDQDFKRIQDNLNVLRTLIAESKLFEEEHKARLLSRVEKLQRELHKRVSDLDRFWGLVGDAGVALGKFGKDAKPIVDRIREIAKIVWRAQSAAEQLPGPPTDLPLLQDQNGAGERDI